jgi:hypothetical protein
LTTLIVEFGRQTPLFGIGARTMGAGETGKGQINLGLVALMWLPFSLPAMLAHWETGIRADALAEALAAMSTDVEFIGQPDDPENPEQGA